MRIFIHSIRLVFQNFGQALRLTLLPYLATFILGLALTPATVSELQGRIPVLVLLSLADAVVGLWAAVAWHRYILLDEPANGWIAAFRGDRIGAYFVKLLLIAVVLVPLFFVVGFAVVALSRIVPQGYVIAGIAFTMFALTVIANRLMPVAVAAALGRPLTLKEAWNATRGHFWTLVGLVVLELVVGISASLLATLAVRFNLIAGVALSAAYGWLARVVAISLITTIYGHFVEQRPIR